MTARPAETAVSAAAGWLGIAALAVVPLADLGGWLRFDFLPKRAFSLSLFDVLIWASALALLVGGGLGGRRGGIVRALAPALPLLLAAIASLVQISRPDRAALLLAGKVLFQWTEYLAIAPLVWVTLAAEPLWRPRLWGALRAGLILAAASACLDLLRFHLAAGGMHPHEVGGIVGDRHLYGFFAALALCLVLPRQGSAGGFLLAGAALTPMLSAGPLFAAALGVAFLWIRRWAHWGGLLAVLLMAWLAFQPSSARRVLARSIQTYGAAKDPGTGDLATRPTYRAMRTAAEINCIAACPWGVGAGQYQKRIGGFFGDIPVPEGRTDQSALYDIEANEPSSFPWFTQIGCQLGLPGLAALALLLASLFARAFAESGGLAAEDRQAIVGCVLVLLLAGCWISPLVRGVGPLLGFLLALSATARPPEAASAAEGRVPTGSGESHA